MRRKPCLASNVSFKFCRRGSMSDRRSTRRMPVELHRVAGSTPAGRKLVAQSVEQIHERRAKTRLKKEVSLLLSPRRRIRTMSNADGSTSALGAAAGNRPRLTVIGSPPLVTLVDLVRACRDKPRRMPAGLHGGSARASGKSAVRARPRIARCVVAQKKCLALSCRHGSRDALAHRAKNRKSRHFASDALNKEMADDRRRSPFL